MLQAWSLHGLGEPIIMKCGKSHHLCGIKHQKYLMQQLILYLLFAACPWIHNYICIPAPSQGELWAWLTAPMAGHTESGFESSPPPRHLEGCLYFFPASNECCCTAKQFLCVAQACKRNPHLIAVLVTASLGCWMPFIPTLSKWP